MNDKIRDLKEDRGEVKNWDKEIVELDEKLEQQENQKDEKNIFKNPSIALLNINTNATIYNKQNTFFKKMLSKSVNILKNAKKSLKINNKKYNKGKIIKIQNITKVELTLNNIKKAVNCIDNIYQKIKHIKRF